jgi:pimeloyl-ACP methyl ester carboxylesterase
MTTTERNQSIARWPSAGAPATMRTLMRELAEIGKASITPPPFPTVAMRGHGQSVMVLPGFCCPDGTTSRLRKFLQLQGFDTRTWNCGTNFGPTKSVLGDLEKKIDTETERTGKPISLVGLSLGGTIAREIAKRRPNSVACVVTLGSPINLPVVTPLAPLAQLAALFWDGDVRRTLSSIAEPPPVPVSALICITDGVLDWRASLPHPAPNLKVFLVSGTHLLMGSNPDAQRIVGSQLAQNAR